MLLFPKPRLTSDHYVLGNDEHKIGHQPTAEVSRLWPRQCETELLSTITRTEAITMMPITFMPECILQYRLLITDVPITTVTTFHTVDASGNTISNTSSIVLLFSAVQPSGGGGSATAGTSAGSVVGGIFFLILICACYHLGK